jgi:hypothetical protein
VGRTGGEVALVRLTRDARRERGVFWEDVMRDAFVILIQVVISFLVVGAVMPLVLLTWPAARSAYLGPGLGLAAMVALFALLRRVWPPRKS